MKSEISLQIIDFGNKIIGLKWQKNTSQCLRGGNLVLRQTSD